MEKGRTDEGREEINNGKRKEKKRERRERDGKGHTF